MTNSEDGKSVCEASVRTHFIYTWEALGGDRLYAGVLTLVFGSGRVQRPDTSHNAARTYSLPTYLTYLPTYLSI